MEESEKVGLFKWVVELAPEAKSVIAILLALNLALGYFIWKTNSKYDELYTKYSKLHTEYTDYTKVGSNEILKVNQAWEVKMDAYRSKVELETKERADKWEAKYDEVNAKLQRSDAKVQKTEDLIEAINKKLNK